MAPMPQQPKTEPKTLPRDPALPRQSKSSSSVSQSWSALIRFYNKHTTKGFLHTFSASLRKALSIQNLSQIDRPWENVTLNRCLLVAITILVLTSGFQRLNGKYKQEKSPRTKWHAYCGWVISVLKIRNTARSGGSRGRGGRCWTQSEAFRSNKTQGTSNRGTDDLIIDIFFFR